MLHSKKIDLKNRNFIVIFMMFITMLLNSCALKPILPTKNYSPIENVSIENLGNGKILFYNYGYYCPTMTCGYTTKMNVKANEISLGQINYGEYLIVELDYGEYVFETVYKDVLKIKRTHKVTIDKDTKVIKLSINAFNEKLKVTNSLPAGINQLYQLQ